MVAAHDVLLKARGTRRDTGSATMIAIAENLDISGVLPASSRDVPERHREREVLGFVRNASS